MVNRIRTNSAAGSGHQHDLENSTKLLTSSKTQRNERHDELIVSLADQYENRRARQVGEWERLYGQNVYKTF